jgi:geranylgeranyl diphosphate synthase type I
MAALNATRSGPGEPVSGQRTSLMAPPVGAAAHQAVLGSAYGDHGAALLGEIQRHLASESDLTAICRYAVLPAGKLFRPILLLQSALAVGGDPARVLPAAAGTEYGHVASLIHDDVIDGDDVRRGRPSVPNRFGLENAIVSGDSLLFGIFLCLAACRERGVPDDRIVLTLRVVAQAGIDLCEGQSQESRMRGDLGCGVDDYLTMIRNKTAALFRASCQSGGLLGGGTERQVEALGVYGDSLGLAFQIWDDLLAYTSDSATAGKSAVSDIRNRRITLPVIFVQQAAGAADRAALERIMTGAEPPEVAHERMLALVTRTGAVDASRALAVRHVESALTALGELPPTPSRARLATFAEAVVDRGN